MRISVNQIDDLQSNNDKQSGTFRLPWHNLNNQVLNILMIVPYNRVMTMVSYDSAIFLPLSKQDGISP